MQGGVYGNALQAASSGGYQEIVVRLGPDLSQAGNTNDSSMADSGGFVKVPTDEEYRDSRTAQPWSSKSYVWSSPERQQRKSANERGRSSMQVTRLHHFSSVAGRVVTLKLVRKWTAVLKEENVIAFLIYPGINNNMAPHYRRATAIGLQQTIGNTAGVVAPQVYRAAPYRLGHWCSLGSAIICIVLITLKILYLRALNRKKEQISSGEREDDRKETTGEGALDFRYIY
ncbi:unnamed protein product [Clonostachys rosea f. rosea IK726]|uniref:Uncharacterized protein n=1 Tax=Clonostachys rosea f. rosea IK726 TaxID=1349383 RepID=A0ACA9UN69_BIOOC|nr:unnamed protein product [Clonostachys rosea f. rosea IK726]